MSALFPTYAKWDIIASKGEGTLLFDVNGKEYLDFVAGIAVCNLGHCHPKVNEALKAQVDKLWHVSNLFQLEGQEKVAQLLVDNSVGDYVFFCNSGAEANEAAIKLARKATGKHKMISLTNSFHGRTLGSMSATGQDKVHQGFGPLLSEFMYAPLNDIKALTELINDEIAAIIIEVIQGEGGVRLMDQAYADAVATICKENNILLIVDEIQTGVGRTGKRFAYEYYNLSPDIVTLAKGLGNGFPVGAMIGKAHLKPFFEAGSHGSTFGGNPLAMAAAGAVLEEIYQDSFLEEVQVKGEVFRQQLSEALLNHPLVEEVRGLGLMVGIECKEEVAPIMQGCREKGLLVLQAGPKVLRLLPSLIVTNKQLKQAVQIIEQVFSEKLVTNGK